VVVGIFAVAFLAIGMAAAAYIRLTPHPVAIGAVLADLRQYDGQTVLVQGIVQGSANVGGLKGYILKDDTGSITVVTQRGLPKEGQYMQVNGEVKQAFAVLGMSYTVLLEGQAPDE
jgi:hypothetical protein